MSSIYQSVIENADVKEENINIRAAIIHIMGDMLQSIGVIVASFIIYFWPEAKIADPICTYLFTVLVLCSTVPVSIDCVKILMEMQPDDIESEEVLEEIKKTKGIYKVTDFHLWSLSGSKNILTAHIYTNKCSSLRYRYQTHKI